MLPIIQENSLIFVDTSKTNINNKDIFVVNVDGELFIKKIHLKDNTFYLRSLNKEYKDIEVKEFKIVGMVKGVLNKI